MNLPHGRSRDPPLLFSLCDGLLEFLQPLFRLADGLHCTLAQLHLRHRALLCDALGWLLRLFVLGDKAQLRKLLLLLLERTRCLRVRRRSGGIVPLRALSHSSAAGTASRRHQTLAHASRAYTRVHVCCTSTPHHARSPRHRRSLEQRPPPSCWLHDSQNRSPVRPGIVDTMSERVRSRKITCCEGAAPWPQQTVALLFAL